MGRADLILEQMGQPICEGTTTKEFLKLVKAKLNLVATLRNGMLLIPGKKQVAKELFDMALSNGWKATPTRGGDLFMIRSPKANIIIWSKGSSVELVVREV